jgi:hypothetical protein
LQDKETQVEKVTAVVPPMLAVVAVEQAVQEATPALGTPEAVALGCLTQLAQVLLPMLAAVLLLETTVTEPQLLAVALVL